MMGFAVPVTTLSLVFSLMFLTCLDVGRAAACSSDEYERDERCCLLCPAGSHVSEHCKRFTQTSCAPCPDGTYLHVPNGRPDDCLTCNNCSAAPGLKVKSPCTSTSNAVCGPSEGFYCVHLRENMCFEAKNHSSCRPGQYVLQRGTSSTDTVCADCPPSCESIKAGNHSNDSTPEEESHSNHYRYVKLFSQTPTGVVVGVAVAVVVGGIVGVVIVVDVYGVRSSHDVVGGCGALGLISYVCLYYIVLKVGCMGYFEVFLLVCFGVALGFCVGVVISVVKDIYMYVGVVAVHGVVICFIIDGVGVFIDVVVVAGLVILPLIRRSCQRIDARRKNDTARRKHDTQQVTEGPSQEETQPVSMDRIQPQDQFIRSRHTRMEEVVIMENPIPQDQLVSIQPQDQSVSIQPQDQSVSIQPQDQPVSIQPQETHNTLMDMIQEITELKRQHEEKDAKIAHLESRLSDLEQYT